MEEVPETEHFARNSALFLQLTPHNTFQSILTDIQPTLHYTATWRDVSASACMAVRLFEAFLAGGTLGKGRFQEYKPETTSFLPQLRTLLANHTIPDLRTLQCSVLHNGKRYTTPRLFCSALGLTNASTCRRRALVDPARLLRGKSRQLVLWSLPDG